MNSNRPSTPPPNPPYQVNQELIVDTTVLGKPFKKGVRVKILKVKDNSTTGSTLPLTAANAVYKISMMVEENIFVTDPPILSERRPHKALDQNRFGTPSPTLYTIETYVYLNTPWIYKRQGEKFELARGAMLQVVGHAVTNTGSTNVHRPRDAHYRLSVVRTELRRYEKVCDPYVVHTFLKKP